MKPAPLNPLVPDISERGVIRVRWAIIQSLPSSFEMLVVLHAFWWWEWLAWDSIQGDCMPECFVELTSCLRVRGCTFGDVFTFFEPSQDFL
jgi:hypothetical protein